MKRLHRVAWLVFLGGAQARGAPGELVAVEQQILRSQSLDRRAGQAVAADGDLALVGIPDDDDLGIDSGAAALFRRGPSSWGLVSKLLGAGSAAGANCGSNVALSGGFALVTCPGSNAVQLWDVSKSPPVQVSGGLPFNPPLPSSFGNSFALAMSDGRAVVAFNLAEQDVPMHVFENQGGAWKQTDFFKEPSIYGPVVGLALRGGLLVSGTPYSSVGSSAVVRVRELTAGVFGAAVDLSAPPDNPQANFGLSVATDGSQVFVGQSGFDNAAGRVWVASKNGGSWTLGQ